MFYQHQLKHHSNSETVIDYVKGRGLSGATVKKFMMGYAPSEWEGLCQQLGRNQEQKEQLVELKLASEKTPGKQFDFFRDRLMFPIRVHAAPCQNPDTTKTRKRFRAVRPSPPRLPPSGMYT